MRGRIEAPELVEQRGFPAARGAQQHDEFAGEQIQVHAPERRDGRGAFAIDPREIAHVEERLAIASRAG